MCGLLKYIIVLFIFETCSTNERRHIKSKELEFVERIKQEKDFETLLFGRSSDACKELSDIITIGLKVPTVLLTEKRVFYLKGSYSQDMLAVACLADFGDVILQNVTRDLQHLRSTRVLISVKQLKNESSSKQIRRIFTYCAEQHMLNVVIILDDFATTGHYYRYKKFPQFDVETLVFGSYGEARIYPDRLRDLYGYPIRTLPDNLQPRSIVYFDVHNRIVVTGYIWNILDTFARYINATLVFPIAPKTERIFFNDLILFTRNNTLDIPATATAPPYMDSIAEYSYPVNRGDWCIMVPVEQEIPRNEIVLLLIASTLSAIVFALELIYAFLISSAVYLLDNMRMCMPCDFFLNGSSIRGLLGQSIPVPAKLNKSLRMILLLLFVTGLFYSNIYLAYYQAYLTRPPLTKRITNLDELSASSLKLLMVTGEYFQVPQEVRDKYTNMFELLSSVHKVADMRASLNTSYAFMAPTDVWVVFSQQQEYFARKLFRRTDICFMRSASLHMMLQENSVYRDILNTYLEQLFAAGLVDYWEKCSFYYMLKAGKVSYADWSETYEYKAAKLSDYMWIIKCFCIAQVFCVLSFGVEWFWYAKRIKFT